MNNSVRGASFSQEVEIPEHMYTASKGRFAVDTTYICTFTAKNDEISPHFCWGYFGETESFPIISLRGNGNFRYPQISHRDLPISLKFPSKNYGEIFIFYAVISYFYCSSRLSFHFIHLRRVAHQQVDFQGAL